jgi:tetratricopeptide (TPR) repeat protein
MLEIFRRVRSSAIGIACWFALIAWPEAAPAQFFTTETPTQPELLQAPAATQGEKLAGVVRRTSLNRKCSSARVSLEKTFDNGSGAWLVQCEEGQDYWVTVPAEAKKAAIALPCILVRTTTQTDCYANSRTVLPEHAEQCYKSPNPDRIIGACTAIIQSGRLNEQREALSTVYQARAAGFSQYSQFDLALGDFDRAVSLSPTSPNALYNRAVALERKGDFDQAIRDLNEALRLEPDHPLANYERGFVFLMQKDYSRAIPDFDQALRTAPENAKAWRGRAQAYRAKGELAKADADQQRAAELDPINGRTPLKAAFPTQASPSQAPAAEIKTDLTETDKQAAYCMQASGGYVSQYTRLTSLLRDNIKTGEAFRERPALSPTDKEKITARLKSLGEAVGASETSSKQWNTYMTVFTDYLVRRGLLGGEKIIPIAENARQDQQAVAETYSACLRLCKPEDPSCKNACQNKATASEASQRMLRCAQVATGLK